MNADTRGWRQTFELDPQTRQVGLQLLLQFGRHRRFVSSDLLASVVWESVVLGGVAGVSRYNSIPVNCEIGGQRERGPINCVIQRARKEADRRVTKFK